MQARLVLAISLSIILIGTAFLTRFFNRTDNSDQLVLESNPVNIEGVELFGNNFSKEVEKITTSDTEKPSGTDLFGRGLIGDYINLAASGQATQENLDSLAEMYINNIGILGSSKTINAFDLKIISSNKTNLSIYADNLVKIENEYKKTISILYSQTPSTELGPELYLWTQKFGKACEKIAEDLQLIPTPTIVSILHVDLVNYYLSCSNAMLSIARTQEDPAQAFAGLATFNQQVSNERVILSDITTILNANGI